MKETQQLLRKDDERDTLNSLFKLAEGLQQEIKRYKYESETLSLLSRNIKEFKRQCQESLPELSYTDWRNLWRGYRSLVHQKASILNELSNFARSYPTMEEFWADTDAQAQGMSHYTFWDTYEHGRRRQLEQLLAKAYGSESALLLNTGMSAIAVVVEMLKLRPGAKVLTGERCYFETSDYLERYLVPRGIELVRVSVDEPTKMVETITKIQPELAIFETVINFPSVPVLSWFPKYLSASPETFFLIDNSVQSHLTRWFEMIECIYHSRILVVESAGKYLTHECMAGVVYGCTETVERARDFARATGQQLQEKAFNYLCETEIAQVSWQLARHSRNVTVFKEELKPYQSCFEFIRSLDSGIVQGHDAAKIFNNGVGALLFVSLPVPTIDEPITLAQKHRRLLNDWFMRVKELELDIQVRCGFGWNETVARVYESERLNQADAPSYLRVSVGIEPLSVIRSLAQALGEASRNIMREDPN